MHSTIKPITFADVNNKKLYPLKSMNIENLKSQMRKGMLEFCILLILSRRDVYASEMLQELKEAKLIVVEGTLYPLLTRLKNDGLLEYRWEESTSGPPRKYYSLSETGRIFLTQLSASWDEISQSITHLKNLI